MRVYHVSPENVADERWWHDEIISTAPDRGAELAAMMSPAAEARMLFDWAGGLIWLELAPSDDAGAGVVRRAVRATGGHATLIRAPAATRAAVEAFQGICQSEPEH